MLEHRFRPLADRRAQQGIWLLLLGVACAAAWVGMTVTPLSSTVLVVALALPLVWLLINFPEVTLALFVSAGAFKADQQLQALSGPVDPTLGLAALLVAGILVRGRFAAGRSLWTREVLLGLLFAALLFSSLLYAPSTDYGYEKALRFGTLTVLAFVAPLFVLGSMAQVQRFFLALVAVGVALALSAVTGAAPEERLTAFESAGTISLGRGVGIAALILLFWLPAFPMSWMWKLAGVGLIVFLLAAQLATGAKGPFFSLLGTAGATALAGLVLGWRNASLPRHTALGVIILTLLLGMAVAWMSPIVPQESLERIEGFSITSLEEDPSASVRFEAWDEAVQAFQEHPVFGIGVGGSSTSGIGRLLFYPHNIVLEIAAEVGLLGLGLFSFLLLAVLLRLLSACAAIRRTSGADVMVPLIVLALLLFSLAGAMVSGDLNDGRMLWLMFGVALAVVALLRQPESAKAGFVPTTGTDIKPSLRPRPGRAT